MELLSRRVSRVFDRTQEDIPIITIERAASGYSSTANDQDHNVDDNEDDDDDDSSRDLLTKSQLLIPSSPR